MSARPKRLKLKVPTFYGQLMPAFVKSGGLPKFCGPYTQLLVEDDDGVRITLGSHTSADQTSPYLRVEQHPGGWAIILYPEPGQPSAGHIYFFNEHRCILRKDSPGSAVEVVEFDEQIPLFDPRPWFRVQAGC